MFCTKCGARLNDGARFCGVCGTPVSSPNDPVVPGAGTAPASAPAPIPAAPAVQPAPIAVQPAAPQPQAPTPASLAQQALPAYVQQVAARLGETPQIVPELQTYLFVTKRFSAALAIMVAARQPAMAVFSIILLAFFTVAPEVRNFRWRASFSAPIPLHRLAWRRVTGC